MPEPCFPQRGVRCPSTTTSGPPSHGEALASSTHLEDVDVAEREGVELVIRARANERVFIRGDREVEERALAAVHFEGLRALVQLPRIVRPGGCEI